MLLILARNLEPDPRGFGTHEQIGFTTCYFLRWTGQPCPTCGATTAWAHAMRGNFLQAAAVNLGGALAWAVAVVGVPWLLLTALVGRWLIVQPRLRPLLMLATAWLLVIFLDWLQRSYFR